MHEQQLRMSCNCYRNSWLCHWVYNYSIMNRFACINEWIVFTAEDKNCYTFLRNLAPITNVLKAYKKF